MTIRISIKPVATRVYSRCVYSRVCSRSWQAPCFKMAIKGRQSWMHLEGKPGRQKSCQQAKHAVCKAPLKVTNKKGKPLIDTRAQCCEKTYVALGLGSHSLSPHPLPLLVCSFFKTWKAKMADHFYPKMSELPQKVFKNCRNPGESERERNSELYHPRIEILGNSLFLQPVLANPYRHTHNED